MVNPVRPTFPEDAYVLPPGHLQLETGYRADFYEGDPPTLHVVDVLVALGVADLVEVRLGWDALAAAGGEAGVGDLTLGVKGGFFGGLDSNTALAGIVLAELPTGTHGFGLGEGVRFFGGLSATQVIKTVQFDLQAALDTHLFIEDPTFFLPISLGINWAPIESVQIYGDGLVSLDLTDLSDTQTSILAGAGYRFIPQLELNAALRVGLSPSLPDASVQVGVAWLAGRLW